MSCYENYRQIKSATRSSVCSLTWPLGWSKRSNNSSRSTNPNRSYSYSYSNNSYNKRNVNNLSRSNNLSHNNVSKHSSNVNNTSLTSNVHRCNSNNVNSSNSLQANIIQVATSANQTKAIETRIPILFLGTDTEADTRSHLCIITISVPPTLAYLGCEHSFHSFESICIRRRGYVIYVTNMYVRVFRMEVDEAE